MSEKCDVVWRKAQKRPVVVEFREAEAKDRLIDAPGQPVGEIIFTKEGSLFAKAGKAFVIKGVEGELYPIQKDIFAKTYDVVDPEKPVCVICHGKFEFPSKTAYGIKPDRKSNPDLFICWECVHWLCKVFLDHIENFSYCYLFLDKAPKIGKYSSRVIRNEKLEP